jgi:protein phosphatase
MVLTSHGLTDPGCVRSENQDRILFDDDLGLYVVCDGLGGRRRGDVAAELATETIRQYVECSRDPKEVTWPYGYNLRMSLAANRLSTAARLANRQVWRRSEEALEYLGMGTTISAVLLEPRSAAIANIGDTRVYLLRHGILEQLSVDDTVAGPSVPASRGVLTSAAGSRENADVHLKECALENGDIMLLASDGLHGIVPDDRITAVMSAAASINEGAADLIAAAREAGAPDNVSAVVFQVAQVS